MATARDFRLDVETSSSLQYNQTPRDPLDFDLGE